MSPLTVIATDQWHNKDGIRSGDMVIYVDILLFVNTIINYAILMTTEKMMKRSSRLFRLIAGALIGALFSLVIFADIGSRLLPFLLKSISTVVITFIAFGWKSRSEYIKVLLCNIIVSVLYSGFIILFYEFVKPSNMVIINNVPYLQINPLILLTVTVAIYFILLLISKLFHERIKSTVAALKFSVDGKDYSCIGKIDTGCNLTEPFSQSPVIIVDNSVYQIDSDTPKRIIPYSTVNGSSFLYAVKADGITIDKNEINRSVYIASSDIHNQTFQAIINSEIIR